MSEPSQEDRFDEVYDGPEDDDEGLTTDELRPEEEVTEFEPPQGPSTPTSEGLTPREEEYGETIDDRLAQEQPEEKP